MDEMQEIIQDFIVETTEILDGLDQKFVELEKTPGSQELLNAIFRAVHTTKGAAGFLGFKQIVDMSHTAENLLNKLRQETLKVTPSIMDALLKSVDMLKLLLSHVRERDGKEEDISGIINELKVLESSVSKPETQPSSADAPVSDAGSSGEPSYLPVGTKGNENVIPAEAGIQSPSLRKQGTMPNELDSRLHGNDGVEASSCQRLESAPKVEKGAVNPILSNNNQPRMLGEVLLEKKVITKEQLDEAMLEQRGAEKIGDVLVRKGFIKKDDITGALSTQGKTADTLHETTIRVDIKRLDNVLNLVGELVLGRNRLVRLAGDMEARYGEDETTTAIRKTISSLNVITTDLQLAVMKTRMQPIGRVFSKFPRMVRDLARVKGKEIELTLIGEDTELDKTVIEEIGDPLVHLIRNSVDHGIEKPDVRSRGGKKPKGAIVLSAYHKGNNIFITIEDDGGGIDANILREKIVEKGIMTKQEADKMGDKEVLSVIFMPGFSTAKEVTDVSGRGVGMDVVKTNISKLNGTIDIDTEVGKGTKITIGLPLTLAIIQTLMVESGGEVYALPLSIVVEILRTDAGEIRTVDKKEVIYVRNTVYPLMRLSKLLGKAGTDADRPYVVIIAMGDKQVGVLVDALHGQEEIVIKSMGKYLSNIRCIAGATVTGSGQVVLILDIMGIFA